VWGLGEAHMFDVYLSDRRDHLLVVEKGQPIHLDQHHLGRWHKKRAAVAVSDQIRTVPRDRTTPSGS
jgi:hypothetical protein